MPQQAAEGLAVAVRAWAEITGTSRRPAARWKPAGSGEEPGDARTRVSTGLVFGIFEAGMPVLGLALGHSLASTLGHAARWVGAGLLIATGGYGLIQVMRADAGPWGPPAGCSSSADCSSPVSP